LFRKKWEVCGENIVLSRHWRYSKAKKAADEENWYLFVKDDAWVTGIQLADYTVYTVRRAE
jgi:hypothetical protein